MATTMHRPVAHNEVANHSCSPHRLKSKIMTIKFNSTCSPNFIRREAITHPKVVRQKAKAQNLERNKI